MALLQRAAIAAVVLAWSLPGGAEETNGTSWVLTGQQREYAPLLRLPFKGTALEAPASVGARLEGVTSYPADRNETALRTGAGTDLFARVGLSYNTKRALIPFNFGVDYEHDLITGSLSGEPELAGEGLPYARPIEHQLRKAKGRASLGYYLHLSGGLDTSQFGLGLLANDGAQSWTPGSARFSDPRGGDRVLRLAVASGPVTDLRLFAAFGHDWVQDDDTMTEGDSSRQFIGTFIVGRDLPTSLGFYAVRRYLESEGGDTLDVWAVDLFVRTSHDLPRRMRLTVALEAALIVGKTTLTSTTTFPENDVFQLGAALQANLEVGRRFGVALDLLYASGDSNFDDAQQNAFKPDPNYELGLLLYRNVMAGLTGRAFYTASDPHLSGYPTKGLERYPTHGSASNTVAFFPRAWVRLLAGLELYGGPLLAFTAAPLADPLNTKAAGGDPRNALDGDPGRYLGTELDVGARLRTLFGGTQLTTGLEAGLLFPGDALSKSDGSGMGPIFGSRLILAYQL